MNFYSFVKTFKAITHSAHNSTLIKNNNFTLKILSNICTVELSISLTFTDK